MSKKKPNRDPSTQAQAHKKSEEFFDLLIAAIWPTVGPEIEKVHRQYQNERDLWIQTWEQQWPPLFPDSPEGRQKALKMLEESPDRIFPVTQWSSRVQRDVELNQWKQPLQMAVESIAWEHLLKKNGEPPLWWWDLVSETLHAWSVLKLPRTEWAATYRPEWDEPSPGAKRERLHGATYAIDHWWKKIQFGEASQAGLAKSKTDTALVSSHYLKICRMAQIDPDPATSRNKTRND